MANVTETLRKLIADGKESRYAISQATGVDQAALSRFANGGDLKGESINKLAEHFALELRPRGGKG